MNSSYQFDDRQVFARRYFYDDAEVIAIDLGFAGTDPEVDIVDGTAIVLVPDPDGDRQFEFELPADDAEVFIKNGIISLTVRT